MTEYLIALFVNIIDTLGYAGITFLMILESMILPVPSEAVMPFAGFLWFLGKMSFAAIILFSTLGSIIGSLISYGIGFYGGQPFVKKYGKYFLLKEGDLTAVEKFFTSFGGKTIFFSRFIPVVRHLISMPAGAGKMNLAKFIVYTAVGAGLWHSFLTYAGYYLGSNWAEIRRYTGTIDIFLAALIAALIIFYLYRRRCKRSMDVLKC